MRDRLEKTALLLTLPLALVGCDMGKTQASLRLSNNPLDHDPAGPTAPSPTGLPPDITQCDQGYTYVGFGGVPLVVGRSDQDEGFDRDRVKPLEALRGEYARVLGATPATIDTVANTFGTTPPRWYLEPQASAVSLFSNFRIAFAGCVPATDDPAFDAVPDATTARTRCGAWAQQFWSRTAVSDELDDCVDTMVNKTSAEPQNRLKWAYGCATVLTSAGFLTY